MRSRFCWRRGHYGIVKQQLEAVDEAHSYVLFWHRHRWHPHFMGKSTGSLATSRFLVCTQHMQRRLLRLEEPPDPCDIESLIGSVTPQCLEMLATLQIPEHDGSIVLPNNQCAPTHAHVTAK